MYQLSTFFKKTAEGLGYVMTFPVTQMSSMKYLALFIDDLWLYFYDKRTYRNTMLIIFETGNKIEDIKWSFLHRETKST